MADTHPVDTPDATPEIERRPLWQRILMWIGVATSTRSGPKLVKKRPPLPAPSRKSPPLGSEPSEALPPSINGTIP